MNTKTIKQAKSAHLRGSWQALQRAAQRAREVAAQTGTELIVSRNGVMTRVKPMPVRVSKATQIAQPRASYSGGKP